MPQPEKYSKTAWVFSKMLDITSSTEKIEILPLRKEKKYYVIYVSDCDCSKSRDIS